MWTEGEIFIKYYSKIPSRFCWISFDSEKLNREQRGICSAVQFVHDKEEFSFIWVQFQFIRVYTSMNGHRPNTTVNHSVTAAHIANLLVVANWKVDFVNPDKE